MTGIHAYKFCVKSEQALKVRGQFQLVMKKAFGMVEPKEFFLVLAERKDQLRIRVHINNAMRKIAPPGWFTTKIHPKGIAVCCVGDDVENILSFPDFYYAKKVSREYAKKEDDNRRAAKARQG